MSHAAPHDHCDYCGLPIRNSRRPSQAELFCCIGCELAANITSDHADADTMLGRTALRLGLAVFFTMNVMVGTMVLWSWDAYAVSAAPHAAIFKDLVRLACLIAATPVVAILGRPLIANVYHQVRQGKISTDVLLVGGVLAAYLFSISSILTGGEHIYLEVACMILLAVTLGRWLEATSKQRAMKSLESLHDMLPTQARRVGGQTAEMVPLAEIQVGEIIRVLPGERIPLDGTVSAGSSFVDQRIVTGESRAFQINPHDHVFGGTANLDGSLDLVVTASSNEGVIQRLIDAVRTAASRTSRPERMADRLASIFAPLICLIGIAVFIAHYRSDGLHAGMMASMSVALIACPCALAIATPLAIWAALSRASEQGIIFRSGDDLMALASVTVGCLDKTGTVTTGTPRLIQKTFVGVEEDAGIGMARALAAHTQHPLASALLDEYGAREIAAKYSVASANTIPGKGVHASVTMPRSPSDSQPATAVLGSRACCRELGLQFPDALQTAMDQSQCDDLSTVFVGWENQVRGCFAFAETLRPEASAAIEAMKSMGLKVLLLTGDQPRRSAQIADELGIGVQSELLPADKQQAIVELQSQGERVAMVGDGLNDAPSLRLADVGVALGCGVEVSRDAAGVCLLASNLQLLPWAIKLAKRTRSTIRRNLFWALCYNTVGMGLAASGRLNPIFAATAMVLSSIFVIAESLRLGASTGSALGKGKAAGNGKDGGKDNGEGAFQQQESREDRTSDLIAPTVNPVANPAANPATNRATGSPSRDRPSEQRMAAAGATQVESTTIAHA